MLTQEVPLKIELLCQQRRASKDAPVQLSFVQSFHETGDMLQDLICLICEGLRVNCFEKDPVRLSIK